MFLRENCDRLVITPYSICKVQTAVIMKECISYCKTLIDSDGDVSSWGFDCAEFCQVPLHIGTQKVLGCEMFRKKVKNEVTSKGIQVGIEGKSVAVM
jgi:hypothetical protein